MDLSNFLRTRRRRLGLTVADAARIAGLTYWQWRALETMIQRRPPPPEVAISLAGALECEVAEVYAAAGVPAAEQHGEPPQQIDRGKPISAGT